MVRRTIIAGNWKMNLSREGALQLARAVREHVVREKPEREVVLAPPFPYLPLVGAEIEGSAVVLSAQDVSSRTPGAFTGEVAAEMLLEVGCGMVIVGHSERRVYGGDTDEVVRRKVRRATDLGLRVILCVGEKEGERDRGEQEDVVRRQLVQGLADLPREEAARKLVIAYEPVWAIGTGKTATPGDAAAMHRFVRETIAGETDDSIARSVPILYGGSVKPGNAAELLAEEEIDGALIGGASLDADSFLAILSA